MLTTTRLMQHQQDNGISATATEKEQSYARTTPRCRFNSSGSLHLIHYAQCREPRSLQTANTAL